MRLNPDKEVVELIKQGLKARNGYCPCELDMNEDNKCPCKAMREEQECRCGLYIK